jgi:hypothetical protein
MPCGRPKNPKNHAPQEAIAYFLQWADECGFDEIPAVTALRSGPTAHLKTPRRRDQRDTPLLNVA